MYKIASDRRQSSLHHGRPSDWINGEERLAGDDLLAQLRQTAQLLEERILALPPGCEERRALGRVKNEVQLRLKAIREDRPKSPVEWKVHFVNEARRILSPSQFEMIFNASKIAAQREESNRAKEMLKKSDSG